MRRPLHYVPVSVDFVTARVGTFVTFLPPALLSGVASHLVHTYRMFVSK